MSFAVSVEEAADLIVREDPDLAIVVVDRDDEHALALIGESVELASGPVIAQLRDGDVDVDFIARAAERGISAYVASNDPEQVQAAIEVAVRRYREAALLHDKIGQLEGARPPGGDRAREGHAHGAPRRRRARGLRAPAQPRPDGQPAGRRRGRGRARRPRAAAPALAELPTARSSCAASRAACCAS